MCKLPSLRIKPDEDYKSNPLEVTPQFQQHVAKHLTRMLDKQLQESVADCDSVGQTLEKRKRSKSGVKLLRTSNSFIKLRTKERSPVIVARKRANSASSEDENRCKSVAVSGHGVLSKGDVAAWSKRSKGKIFSYTKMKDGVLTSID